MLWLRSNEIEELLNPGGAESRGITRRVDRASDMGIGDGLFDLKEKSFSFIDKTVEYMKNMIKWVGES